MNTGTETSTFNAYTIVKDFDKQSVLITRTSPRARLGLKIIHHYSFRSKDAAGSILRMNKFVDEFIKEENEKITKKILLKERLQQARKDFVNPFTLGQILYRSWGYDQTNVDFYQVIKVDIKSITVRKLAQNRTESGFMSGTTMPIKDNFISDKLIRKIVQVAIWGDNIKNYVTDMYPWNGNPVCWSSYH